MFNIYTYDATLPTPVGKSPRELTTDTAELDFKCIAVTKKAETEADFNPTQALGAWTGTNDADGNPTAAVTGFTIVDTAAT